MNRMLVLMALTLGVVATACGSAATASNGASSSPTPQRGGAQFRNGAAGQLVQVNGQTLILTGPSGDLTVTFSSTTTFTRTSTAVLADIVPGVCIVATGQKDSTGLLTATTVRLSPKPAAGCAAAGRFGPNASPPPGASPPPQASDRKSTRLNSSHDQISYAVFCLKKKTKKKTILSWKQKNPKKTNKE